MEWKDGWSRQTAIDSSLVVRLGLRSLSCALGSPSGHCLGVYFIVPVAELTSVGNL